MEGVGVLGGGPMKLIPGLPKLERKQDLAECAVPGCTRKMTLTYLGWPLCQEHWDQHCQAEKFEEQKTHTSALLESTCKGEQDEFLKLRPTRSQRLIGASRQTPLGPLQCRGGIPRRLSLGLPNVGLPGQTERHLGRQGDVQQGQGPGVPDAEAREVAHARIESASEAAAAAGAREGARPHLLASFPLRKASGVAQCRSALSFSVSSLPVGRLHCAHRSSPAGSSSGRVVEGLSAARLLSSIRGRVGAIPHWHQNPARLLPITSGSGAPTLRTRPVFALILPDHRRKT